MPARCFNWVMIAVLAPSVLALAQPNFKATPATVNMAEGGRQDLMLVDTDNERFSITIPNDSGSELHADTRSVIFKAAAGDSIITVRFTATYAGGLPTGNTLRDLVAANHPKATLISSAQSSTSLGPAQTFDLMQPAANGSIVRIRDAYVAYPEGSVELTFSCNSADFDKKKFGFARLLYSFRLLTKDAKGTP